MTSAVPTSVMALIGCPKSDTSKTRAKTICVNPTTDTFAGAGRERQGQEQLTDERGGPHRQEPDHHSPFEHAGRVVGPRADQERTEAKHRRHRREMDDNGARVEVAERVQSEHGHGSEQRRGQRRRDAKLIGRKVRLLDQHDTRHADQDGDNHSRAGEEAVERP